MSDLLSHILDNRETGDSQISQMNTGDDFSLSFLDSQSQSQSQFDFLPQKTNKGNNLLEAIQEEDNYCLSQIMNSNNEIFETHNSKGKTNLNNNNNNDHSCDKIIKLSQEIDEIYNESQKFNYEPSNINYNNNLNMNTNINHNNINNNNNSIKNFCNNNNNFNVYNNQHNNFQTNNNTNGKYFKILSFSFLLKGILAHFQERNNSSISNIINNNNLNNNSNNNNKAKQSLNKVKIQNNFSDEFNCEFKVKTDELIQGVINKIDSMKNNFCNFVESFKQKFINDASSIKNILILNCDYNLQEEERNKIIDVRIEMLHKEIFSILNEFQR